MSISENFAFFRSQLAFQPCQSAFKLRQSAFYGCQLTLKKQIETNEMPIAFYKMQNAQKLMPTKCKSLRKLTPTKCSILQGF